MGEGVGEGAGISTGWVGLGYAGFSLGMTLGRFSGDRVRTRWGSTRILQGSGILVLAGIAVALLLPRAVPAVAGFTLVGLGCANCVPVIMSRAATLPGVAAAEALALVGRLAYLGLLLGPVLIGFTADHAGLAAGIALIGGGGLVISLGSRRALGGTEGQATPAARRG
jgi:MFS family permease